MHLSVRNHLTNLFANDRNKSFTINTLLNFTTRFGVIGINLLLVPLLLTAVGKERFGIWQTILAILSWSSLLNFESSPTTLFFSSDGESGIFGT
jgi:hypothetical protein